MCSVWVPARGSCPERLVSYWSVAPLSGDQCVARGRRASTSDTPHAIGCGNQDSDTGVVIKQDLPIAPARTYHATAAISNSNDRFEVTGAAGSSCCQCNQLRTHGPPVK